ncbi:hypothetical protein ACLMJK_001570 [Lecanora helva]
MASKPDYDALRARTMGTGSDEAVTVNTRALIDKVLARYSGEWTTLRELLQNAADASASKVVIQFDTAPSSTIPVPQSPEASDRIKHVLLHHTMRRMIVENDGEVFKDTDWARLKKIAEGNPDETKIGAFGVGFYSVFADCEEPLVSSGKEALAFYWRKDALYTKRSTLPDGQNTNTTFILPMRNQNSPIPPLMSLCQFLASSLTFVGLEEVELRLDEWKLLTFTKKIAPSMELQVPREVDKKTQEGLMNVMTITREAVQLDAQWLKVVEWEPKALPHNGKDVGPSSTAKGAQPTQSLRSFFSRLAPGASNNAAVENAIRKKKENQESLEADLMGESKATVFVHVNKAKVKTNVNQNFSFELERATKKPPPKYTTISLLGASYDEQVATSTSVSGSSQAPEIFTTFVPTNGKGRIFIGFTTNQTTGLNVHISTPSVIPTVERESIDLNNRFVRVWNVELLRVAGIVARVSWGNETRNLAEDLSRVVQNSGRKRPASEDIASILPAALFLHETYTWNESTPSPEVGTLIEEAFWTCNQKTTIATLSTQGVIPSADVRLAPEQLGFVEDIPTLPEALSEVGLVRKLIDYGVITEVTISDIKNQLEAKTLTSVQLQRFLEWLAHKARISEVDGVMIRSLLNVAIANYEEDGNGKVIVLAEMKTFLNASRIPHEMPIPRTTLPFKFTRKIAKADLELLGFEDLHLVPWLRWLIENTGGRKDLTADFDVTACPEFASAVLPVISKQWEGLSQSSKATVIELLTARTVIPTKMGMKKPAEAYFPSVRLFDDLPVITGVHSVKDKFFLALGVRKTVEIGVVFERLVDTSRTAKTQSPASSSKWSHVDLIKYLASVRSDIPSADIDRLKTMKICPAETEALQPTSERYMVSELYEPQQPLRQLNLPTMHWPGIYRPESAEGRLLTFLGLRAAPAYIDLVRIMSNAAASQNINLREYALKYFIDHHQIKGYAQFDHSSVTLPYLPLDDSEKKVATPNNCFSNERASILDFDILRRDLRPHASKFGVRSDPPMSECIKRLINAPPETKRKAREVFAYFASRMSDINDQHAESLSSALIVPVVKSGGPAITKPEKSERMSYVPPRICFLGDGEKYADIFDYVNFGHDANTFLLRVGSKHEPTTTELTKLLIREPARIFAVLGDTRYLELLRTIGASWRTLKKDKAIVKDIKTAKCLLAYREISTKSGKDLDEDEEESGIKYPELANASQVVIVDDIITYNMFKSKLLAAPMEETLEEFYYSLGALEISSLLEETQIIGMVSRDETLALKLQSLIQERSRLFLHDHPRDTIKHDAKWVEQNLKVKCVRSISLTKSLRGYGLSRNEIRSAVINPEKAILYVTADGYDMLEISQALVPVLLQRSKPQYIFMLEMILESSLPKLRSRGYNVARLLNQKEAERRVAEEARQQQLEQEQREMREREATWKETQAQNAAKANSMPGVFPDSPAAKARQNTPQTPAIAQEPVVPKPRGFLDGIGRRFGFDKQPSSQIAPPQGNDNIPKSQAEEDTPPPPYQQEAQKPQPNIPQPEAVTAPHHLHRNLISAIQASRPHNSKTLDTTPEVNAVKETATYCDARPGHNISYIGETSSSLRVFLDNNVISNGLTPPKFLAANGSALELFASVLIDCADAFSLSRNSLHIFYDDAGSTIAFNQSKALFFNYRYFANLHLPAVQQGKKGEAVAYWCVVMAHELAHNLVSDHSAQHSYYTESMVIQYFGRIAGKIAGLEGANAAVGAGAALPRDPVGGGQGRAEDGSLLD